MIKTLPNNKLITTLTFTLLLVSLPFERLLTLELFGYTLKLSYIAGLLLIALSLPNLKKAIRPLSFDEIILLLFNLLNFLSIFLATDKMRAVIVAVLIAFLSLLFIVLKHSAKNLDKYLSILVWVAVAASLFGLWQFFADQYALGPSFLREAYTRRFFGFPRIQSTLLEPLYFANFLFLGLFPAIYLYLKQKKRLFLLLLLIIGLAFFLTLSRGAFLALFVSMVIVSVAVLIKYRQYLISFIKAASILAVSLFLALLIVFIASGSTGVKSFISHAASGETLSANLSYAEILEAPAPSEQLKNIEYLTSRAFTTKAALMAAKANPLGIGIGNFGALPEFASLRAEGNYQTTNNLYLEILVETGILGLLLFLLFLLFIGKAMLLQILSGDLRALFFLGVTIAFFTQYLFFSTLYIIYIWVFLGLAISQSNKDS